MAASTVKTRDNTVTMPSLIYESVPLLLVANIFVLTVLATSSSSLKSGRIRLLCN